MKAENKHVVRETEVVVESLNALQSHVDKRVDKLDKINIDFLCDEISKHIKETFAGHDVKVMRGDKNSQFDFHVLIVKDNRAFKILCMTQKGSGSADAKVDSKLECLRRSPENISGALVWYGPGITTRGQGLLRYKHEDTLEYDPKHGRFYNECSKRDLKDLVSEHLGIWTIRYPGLQEA